MKGIAYFLLVFLLSCSSAINEKNKDIRKIISEEDYPKVVAILPFEYEDFNIADTLRKTFYNHFSGKNYTNVELPLVDEKIYQLEKVKGKPYKDISPKEICEAIGCDGVIYGKITDFQKIYAVAYSQLGIEAEVSMYSIKNDKEVFRIKESVRYHEGNIPMSPLSAVMTAVSTAMNLREIQFIRLLNELCYKITEKIPSSPVLAYYKLPNIKEVITNVKDSPFGKGKIIRVGLEGDPGMIASFDIGNFKKGILMREVKKGIYTGEYIVVDGDNTTNSPIIVYLKKPGGYENKWIDVSGLVTIDTVPPSNIKNIKTKGYPDRIEIKWTPLDNTPDLKGYEILRSEQPLSGYKSLGIVEVEEFEDREVIPGKHYFYRIKAIDHAGNESLLSDYVRAQRTLSEPPIISGILNKDTVYEGVYRVKGELIIPKGIFIEIKGGSVFLMGQNTSITVEGKLTIDGTDYTEFKPESDNDMWDGITIKNGYVELRGLKIKNARSALKVIDSMGFIEKSVISNSINGILVDNCTRFEISKTSIFNNKLGIEIVKSSINVRENDIFQNELGIKLSHFSGEISYNNIFNNGVNIESLESYKISLNFFGAINKGDLKIINVIADKVLNKRFPEGKPVEVISNPYLSLTEEERRERATQYIVEGGNFFRQRNYGKAVNKFEEALKAFPTPEVYYYIAICYKEMGEINVALNYLEEAYEKFPKDQSIVKALGLLYYENNENKKAIKFFQELLKLNPEDNQVKFILEKIDK